MSRTAHIYERKTVKKHHSTAYAKSTQIAPQDGASWLQLTYIINNRFLMLQQASFCSCKTNQLNSEPQNSKKKEEWLDVIQTLLKCQNKVVTGDLLRGMHSPRPIPRMVNMDAYWAHFQEPDIDHPLEELRFV